MNSLRFLLPLLALTAAACVLSPRRNYAGGYGGAGSTGGFVGAGTTGGGTVAATAPPPGGINPDPRQALTQVDQALRQQSYQPLGPAVRNANMPTGGVIGYAIDATPSACYTLVALGAPGTDINLVLLDPMGRTLGYNVDPGPNAWITSCPNTQGRLIAQLQMASGQGEYYYVVYQGTAATQPNLAGLFGAGGQAQAQTAQLDQGTAGRVSALDQRLGGERYVRLGEVFGVVHRNGEDRNFPLDLQSGACYAFATLGGQGARDTDVFLADGEGNELARDVSAEIDAVLRFCAPAAGRYTLRTRMYQGEGPLFIASYGQPTGGGQAPPAQQVISAQSTTGLGVEGNYRLLDSRMRARGYEPYAEPTNGELAQAATRDFSMSLEGGKCYAILAVGDNGVRNLDLILMQGSRELDRDTDEDARPIVRVCPENNGDFTMRVAMSSGQGAFVYAPYRWPRGTRGPFNLRGVTYLRLSEVTSLLGVEGYQPDIDVQPLQGRLAREGANRGHPLRLTGGHCYAIVAVGDAGITNVGVKITGGGRELAVDASRNAFPDIRHCVDATGSFNVDVRAEAGSGAYFVQVFRRQ